MHGRTALVWELFWHSIPTLLHNLKLLEIINKSVHDLQLFKLITLCGVVTIKAIRSTG